MTPSRHNIPGARPYYTIDIGADETFPGTDKRLPYATSIGTIDDDGRINVWTPAAPVFRGYVSAARAWLTSIRDTLAPVRTVYAHFKAGPAGPFQTVSVPSKDAPLGWHEKGLSFTASGYGRRIPTRMKVRINGRWRRVYCCIFSNSGTCYVEDTSVPKVVPEGGKVARYPWIVIQEA